MSKFKVNLDKSEGTKNKKKGKAKKPAPTKAEAKVAAKEAKVKADAKAAKIAEREAKVAAKEAKANRSEADKRFARFAKQMADQYEVSLPKKNKNGSLTFTLKAKFSKVTIPNDETSDNIFE